VLTSDGSSASCGFRRHVEVGSAGPSPVISTSASEAELPSESEEGAGGGSAFKLGFLLSGRVGASNGDYFFVHSDLVVSL
jgi:hypothetical protein